MNAALNLIFAVVVIVGAWEGRKLVPKAVAWLAARIAGRTGGQPPAAAWRERPAAPAWEPPQYPTPPPRRAAVAAGIVSPSVDGPTERLPIRSSRRFSLGDAFHRKQPPTVEIEPVVADTAAPLFAETRGDWLLRRPEFQTGTTTAIERLKPAGEG